MERQPHAGAASHGKLRRAAVYWAQELTGTPDRGVSAVETSGTKEAFAALNITFVPDADSGEETKEIDTDYPVPSDIWQSLVLFLALQTQWRMISIGMTGRLFYLGLDYVAATNLMRVKKIKGKKRVMSDLQIMESAALSVLNGGTPDDADRPYWGCA